LTAKSCGLGNPMPAFMSWDVHDGGDVMIRRIAIAILAVALRGIAGLLLLARRPVIASIRAANSTEVLCRVCRQRRGSRRGWTLCLVSDPTKWTNAFRAGTR
jgi:hypothetical protein